MGYMQIRVHTRTHARAIEHSRARTLTHICIKFFMYQRKYLLCFVDLHAQTLTARNEGNLTDISADEKAVVEHMAVLLQEKEEMIKWLQNELNILWNRLQKTDFEHTKVSVSIKYPLQQATKNMRL